MKLPEYARKVIFRQKDNQNIAWGGILIGYCPNTLAYYEEMFRVAKKLLLI